MSPARRRVGEANVYGAVLADIFQRLYRPGATEVEFTREDIAEAAARLGMPVRNLGDVIYSFRYRAELPESISRRAPRGKVWVIRGSGRARYRFAAVDPAAATIVPNERLAEVKVPDATPGIIRMYALTDEQALLGILRYNRLVDTFTGVTSYSLQSHLRTTVYRVGQVETDEVYVGIDKRGAHYVFPVQAKGGRDSISIVQIEQDIALCAEKFPAAICRAIGAQFMDDDLIALFEFSEERGVVVLTAEKHYRLTPYDELSSEEIQAYGTRIE